MAELWLPQYNKKIVYTGRKGERPRRGDAPPRLVLHTTEAQWDRESHVDYPYPPQFTIGLGHPKSMDGAPRGEKLKLQHCDALKTGYALLHRSGEPETNHMGQHCIQTEFISKARWGDEWPNEFYYFVGQHFAEVIIALEEHYGVRDMFDLDDPVEMGESGGWGFDGRYRFSWDRWESFNGLCAHQNVPGNDHWDAGGVDQRRLTRIIKRKVRAHYEGKDPVDEPVDPEEWPLLEAVMQHPNVRIIRGVLVALGYLKQSTPEWHDNYGDNPARAIADFQAARGLPATGVVDAATRAELGTAVSEVLE